MSTLDAGTGPYRDAVRALFDAYSAFHVATGHLPAWADGAEYWFLGAFEDWLLALRDLSDTGTGYVRVRDGVRSLESLTAWIDGFAAGWLDPAAGVLSALATEAVNGRASPDTLALGEGLQDLLATTLPAALAPLGCSLEPIVLYVTPFDDARMVCTRGVVGHPGLVVAVEGVGLECPGALRLARVVVGT